MPEPVCQGLFVSSLENQKRKNHKQTSLKLCLLSMCPRVLSLISVAYSKILGCEHLMDRIKFISRCLGDGSGNKALLSISTWDQSMVTLGRKLKFRPPDCQQCLHPKTTCLLLPPFALPLLWVGKPFLPPARETCCCPLTLPGISRIQPWTVQQWVSLLWLRSLPLSALADTGLSHPCSRSSICLSVLLLFH